MTNRPTHLGHSLASAQHGAAGVQADDDGALLAGGPDLEAPRRARGLLLKPALPLVAAQHALRLAHHEQAPLRRASRLPLGNPYPALGLLSLLCAYQRALPVSSTRCCMSVPLQGCFHQLPHGHMSFRFQQESGTEVERSDTIVSVRHCTDLAC